MRKLMLVLFLVVLVPVGVFAQNAQTSTSVQPLSPQDAAKARAELKNLAQAFGVETATATDTSATTATTATTDTGNHKTMGDAADKALDLVSRAVSQVSATLEKIAPHVWSIMIRQQYAKAVGNLVVPWGLLFLILLYMRIIKKSWVPDKSDKDDKDTYLWAVRVIPTAFGFAAAAWGFVRLSDSIMYIVNPEYYAVRDIITMLLGQTPQ